MTSSIDIMARALHDRLAALGFASPSVEQCRGLVRDMIDAAVKAAEDLEQRLGERERI